MILTCPACGTRYQSEGARFAPPGRNVRCAKCQHIWFQTPPDAELEPEPEPVVTTEPEPAPVYAQSYAPQPRATQDFAQDFAFSDTPAAQQSYEAPPPRRRRNFAPLLGWAGLTIVAMVIGFCVVQYRQTIADIWPQTATLYSAIGMRVNTLGLDLVDVGFEEGVEDGQKVIAVHGRIVNVSDREIPVPEIRVALADDSAHELYHWTFDSGVATLKPGGFNEFSTRLASPPREATRVDVRFAKSGEAP